MLTAYFQKIHASKMSSSAPAQNLKAFLPRNGMLWPTWDHILNTRRRDAAVLFSLVALGVVLSSREVQVALCDLIDLATEIMRTGRQQGGTVSELEFLDILWRQHPLSRHLFALYFVELF